MKSTLGRPRTSSTGWGKYSPSCLDDLPPSLLFRKHQKRVFLSSSYWQKSPFTSISPFVDLSHSYSYIFWHFVLYFVFDILHQIQNKYFIYKPTFGFPLFGFFFFLYSLSLLLPYDPVCFWFYCHSSVLLFPLLCAADLLSLCPITKSTDSSRRSCRRSSPSVRSSLTRVRGTTWHACVCIESTWRTMFLTPHRQILPCTFTARKIFIYLLRMFISKQSCSLKGPKLDDSILPTMISTYSFPRLFMDLSMQKYSIRPFFRIDEK